MTNPIRLLHFADAHIDIANYGRHDPDSALPVRVVDFLKSLDQIVDTAIAEKVDLVIFAGDAYKDRNPQPTFQREWGRRMMKLSQAGIPTVLLVGNHDVSPAAGRAHTLHEFHTLAVPHIHVADRIHCFGPAELGVPVQVIAVPWVSRSQLMTREEILGLSEQDLLLELENRLTKAVTGLIEKADPMLPLILTAHASVQGAAYGSERMVMLGQELVIPTSLVRHKKLDYVALGHIHKHQSLNDPQSHPPIIYPGSIERIDFGEAKERKGFVLAEVEKGVTRWEFKRVQIRPFHDFRIETHTSDTFMADVMSQLPPSESVTDAICRVQLTYPRDWEPLLDEKLIYDHFAGAFSIQLQKHRLAEKRARLGDTATIEMLTPEQLLAKYWQTIELDETEAIAMQEVAKEVLAMVDIN